MNSLQRMVLEYKRLEIRFKSEGAPCEQGEAASRTGCIPASGEGKKKPKANAKPKAGKPKAKKESTTESPNSNLPRPSKAKVTIGRGNKDEIESAAIELLGNDWKKKVASIVGAPDNAQVVCSNTKCGLRIGIIHPKIEACTRYLKKNDEGNLILENMILLLEKEAKGSGFGSEMFSKQVAWAKEHGIKTIECTAGKSDSMNGYYTWPRLGYDCKLTELADDEPSSRYAYNITKSAKSRFPKAETVLDIMSTPEGRKWWKENGVEIHVTFDLTEGSRSLRVLEAYLEERSKR